MARTKIERIIFNKIRYLIVALVFFGLAFYFRDKASATFFWLLIAAAAFQLIAFLVMVYAERKRE